MKKRFLYLILSLTLLFLLSACGYKEENIDKVCDLEFTVLKQEEIPEELAAVIEEKKGEAFNLTYEDNALYIAVGYGGKDTGGYSIEVEYLYLGKTSVCFRTKLIGPEKSEKVQEGISYPYIVVKTEYREEKVKFLK